MVILRSQTGTHFFHSTQGQAGFGSLPTRVQFSSNPINHALTSGSGHGPYSNVLTGQPSCGQVPQVQSTVSQLSFLASQAPLTWDSKLALNTPSTAYQLGKRKRDNSNQSETKRSRYFDPDDSDSDPDQDVVPALAEPSTRTPSIRR